MQVGTDDRAGRERHLLLLQVRGHGCALRLEDVLEVLRPLPLQPVPVSPAFILGLSMLRGEPVPVVDLGALLGYPEPRQSRRFVAIRMGDRRAVLATEGVSRIVSESSLVRSELPPLLAGAAHQTVESLSALDQDFLTVLQAARLVPPETWSIAAAGAPAS